ncbi:terpene synthase family protein [Streptomyces sp. G45]|uniref:terpene synthase family protein n=1 Tax=Streptomyces sp. G45 TaxID=3406627 RepID=UPI003C2843D2
MLGQTFQPPYPVRRSPDVAATRTDSARWARRVGILGPAAEPGFRIWDERDFADFDLPSFASLVHPSADGGLLGLMADWYVWSWYLDDLMLERFKRPRDVPGARAFLARLSAFAGTGAGAPPEAANPAERGLADLWARTAARRSTAWRDRLGGRIPNLFDDALWEVENLARGLVPEPVDYVQMRRAAGGVLWAAQLVEYVLDVDLPAELLARPVFVRALDAFADVIDLHNDLVSYRRETEYEQEVSNAVVVLQAHTGDPEGRAAEATYRLLAARLGLFDRLVAVDIPAVLTAEGTDSATAEAVGRYLGGLKDWLAGDFQWHLETRRYHRSSWHRTPLPSQPHGLGTSAARLTRPALGNAGRGAIGGR